jgi:hypothetical protein
MLVEASGRYYTQRSMIAVLTFALSASVALAGSKPGPEVKAELRSDGAALACP